MLARVSLSVSLALLLGSLAHAATPQWSDRSPGPSVYDLVVDPTDFDHLFAATDPLGTAYSESTDGGLTWQPLAMPTEPFVRTSLACSGAGDVVLCLDRPAAPVNGRTFVVRRTPAGWVPFGPTTTSAERWYASHVRVAETAPDLVAVVMVRHGDPTYGLTTFLHLSSDGGQTWAAPSRWIGTPDLFEIVETASGPSLLRTDLFFPSTGTETVVAYSDGWAPATTYGPAYFDNSVVAISTSRTHPERMFASAYEPQEFAWAAQPLMRSDDVGRTWTPFGPAGHYSDVQRGELDPDLVVRHTGITGGAEVSRDAGATWSSLGNPPGAAARRLRIALTPDDRRLYAYDILNFQSGLWVHEITADVGVSECSAGVNGSGAPARISAHGSSSIAASDLTLWARDLPASTTTLLLTSRVADLVANPAGSFGDLCLGSPIGRYTASVMSSGPFGETVHAVDPLALPSPTGSVQAAPGETWRFQVWFRDALGGQVGSHFSDAVAVTLTQ